MNPLLAVLICAVIYAVGDFVSSRTKAMLPMLFVSGLMGPYMSPIPANASAAMIFSFFVAVIITPPSGNQATTNNAEK